MPKTGKKQDAVLTIRMYRTELDAIEHAANAANKSVSAYVRDSALREAFYPSLPPINAVQPKEKKVTRIRAENVSIPTHSDSLAKKEFSAPSKRKEDRGKDTEGETIARTVSRKTGHELACPCFQCVSLAAMMAPKPKLGKK